MSSTGGHIENADDNNDNNDNNDNIVCISKHLTKYDKHVVQPWYNCYTCSNDIHLGCCMICAQICHAEHKIGNQHGKIGINYPNVTGFFCDCAVNVFKNPCKCQPIDPLIRALGDSTVAKVDTKMVQITQSVERSSTVISPVNLNMGLEMAGVVFGCSNIVNEYIALRYVERPCNELMMACGIFGTGNRDLQHRLDFNIHTSERNDAQTINRFVSKATNGKIDNLLSSEPTGIVLVSALYFDGEWEEPFNADKTKKDRTFYSMFGTSSVDMMVRTSKSDTKFIKTQDLKSIVLPYRNGRFVAIFTLPTSSQAMIQPLLSRENVLDQWNSHLNLKNVADKKVDVMLPKFKKEYSHENTHKILEKVGLDWTSFSSATGIEYVIQKVVLEVDEEGTKGAAASEWIAMGIESLPNADETWHGDRPFIMSVIDIQDGSIIFSGVIDFE